MRTRLFADAKLKTETFTAGYVDSTEILYPVNGCGNKKNETFVRGMGYVKYKAKSVQQVPALSEISYPAIRAYAQQYGIPCVFHALHLDDGSFYKDYSKMEVLNAVELGEDFDSFMFHWHQVGTDFIEAVKEKYNVRFEGEWAYSNINKNQMTFRVDIQPERYIEHSFSCIMRTKPMFDPVRFEKALIKFLIKFENSSDEFLEKLNNTSVHDMIVMMSNKEIAQRMKQKLSL